MSCVIVWLEIDLLHAIHDRQLAEHGGSSGLRDATLLKSALARSEQRYAYGDSAPDLADLAASLAFSLARNHPFVDDNKRTTAIACETFIELNGAALLADDLELFPVYLKLAQGKFKEADFAAWLRDHLKTEHVGGVHESTAGYADTK